MSCKHYLSRLLLGITLAASAFTTGNLAEAAVLRAEPAMLLLRKMPPDPPKPPKPKRFTAVATLPDVAAVEVG